MERTPPPLAPDRTRVRSALSPLARLLVGCSLLLPLAGCPNDTTAKNAAPGRKNAAAIAPALASSAPPVTAAAAAAQAQDLLAANLHAQKVQELIVRAEKSYQAGVSNYNASRLDEARTNFDMAVDLLLSSGVDLKTDATLSDEFERLLSAINSLEMVALKQGNGFSPKAEPAPIDVAVSEETFPVDPALTRRAAAELSTTQSDFPLVVNDEVAFWISYFTNSSAGHAHLRRSLERAGKYKDMIERVLREQGVPQDLIYQAVTESGFQPQVVNRSSGAGGMWQFMPFQGAYGLERNGYFDERFDPEKSTVAYAKYMKFLYKMFGDWYLAMAAYDWGPARVQRVVSRTGYADYWQMSRHGNLPAETKAYIPGVIASIIMAKNPTQYGLTDVVAEKPVLSDTVTTSYAIDLKLVADLTEATVPEIVTLNPALLRLATPREIPYDLHLPPGTHDVFLDRLKDIPEEHRASWRFHVVKAGETLEGVATALHARAAEVAEYNEVTPSQPVEAGDELVVPLEATSSAARGQQRYKTRRGDSLVSIADRFGVTDEQLRGWNKLASSRITPGRTLYVAEPVRLAPSGRSARARRGRTTSGRARSAGVAHARGSVSKTAPRSKATAARSSAPATRSKDVRPKNAHSKNKR